VRTVSWVVLVLFAAAGSAQPSACGAGETLATISFATRIPDAAVNAFIRSHEVTPHAVFMWSHGIYGSYRAPHAGRGAIVEGARAMAVKNFERALEGVAFRADALVDRYSRAEVERDAHVTLEARSLARRQLQHQTILRHARAKAPLIYAIAVCANAAELERLRAAKDVSVAVSQDGRAAARPSRPASMTNEFPAPEIDRLTAADAYARVETIAREKRSRDHAKAR
jgi:hypothetical protein